MKRLGIYGGTFDPIHNGHLLLAETCYRQCHLDAVWFVVAAESPHKQGRQRAPAKDRCAMLRLAIAAHEAFEISTIEIERGGVSYTVDTLETIQQANPDTELFLLVGADSFHELPLWHRIERVCEIALPISVERPGQPAVDYGILQPLMTPERLALARQYRVQMPAFGISSSDIRRRTATGASIRFQTPRAVEEYIASHGLYMK